VWIAIPLDGLTERRPDRLELSPDARAPIVWHFRDGDLSGRLLNVLGWLNGGLVTMSTQGTLYVHQNGGEVSALYLPGIRHPVDLGPKPPRTLSPDKRKRPLYPQTWPPTAVHQVIRRRLRTIVVLSQDALLGELTGAPPSGPHTPAASQPTAGG